MTRPDLRRREWWIHQQIEAAVSDGESLASLTARLGMSARTLRKYLLDRHHRVTVRTDLVDALDRLPIAGRRPGFWTPAPRVGGPGADSGRREVRA